MGTISAVAPIAVEMAIKAQLPVAVAVGAVVGGAMFGDNLSMISDTTIACNSHQGCEMKDKFIMNFKNSSAGCNLNYNYYDYYRCIRSNSC